MLTGKQISIINQIEDVRDVKAHHLKESVHHREYAVRLDRYILKLKKELMVTE